ncbi:LysR family transcriptional regulator [Caulobacter sp. 17J80-11]|uniref:LysR family transcriptional regulator n=1 Tax=Caulobacter sp. 17J80-11 TaxID=2763502 RepID=UPI00165350B6|nr:LysR family transcriptional regulator [Caulobacter sp. 17J80-11]MBC6981259.1 LysR family transcriptional regulator [Caulobacter sp. 17J80-11]
MRDLNDLSFFVAVVTHRGFAPAARALNVPKSSLSRRVARLEERLGVRLLERSTRRFAVTEVGQEFYRRSRQVLEDADAAEEAVARVRAEPQGLVRASVPISFGPPLARALPTFMEAHPRLRLQIVQTNRRVDLIEEGVDVALRVRDRLDTDAAFQLKQLGRSRSFLVASRDFLDRHGRPSSVADLAGLPTLGQNEGPGPATWALSGPDGALQTLSHEPRLSCGDFAVLHQAALDGLGLALVPDIVACADLRDGRLEQVLPDWSGREGIVHLVFPSRRGLLPGVRAFIDFLAETVQAAMGEGRC